MTRTEQRREATRRYRAANPERTRAQWRKSKRKRIVAAAGGREPPEICDACHGPPGVRMCRDHDHTTGAHRGFLCNRCNIVLGLIGDSPEVLRGLEDYLFMAAGPPEGFLIPDGLETVGKGIAG